MKPGRSKTTVVRVSSREVAKWREAAAADGRTLSGLIRRVCNAAAGPKGKSSARRDVVVRLLVTEAERNAMQAAADGEGETLSGWIRMRCIRTTVRVGPAPRGRRLAVRP